MSKKKYIVAPGMPHNELEAYLNDKIAKKYPDYELLQVLLIPMQVSGKIISGGGAATVILGFPVLKLRDGETE